jgi:hypothetical protein
MNLQTRCNQFPATAGIFYLHAMPPAGYSSTPLAKKLGIKEGHLIRLVNSPDDYFELFPDWPVTARIAKDKIAKKDVIHFFVTDAAELKAQLPLLKNEIKETGMIWVSWPKSAAKMKTDVTEDVIRDHALRAGLVDIKVCAVDETWSGLKLVIPVKARGKK